MSVIVMAHPKGGAGKTTSSVHICGEMLPDLIIDLDKTKGISMVNRFRPDDKKFNVVVVHDRKELIETIKAADEEGKTVYVDCGGFDADITRAAIAVADLLICPANDTLTERLGLVELDQILIELSNKMGFPITAHLLLCKTNPNKKHYPKFEDILQRSSHIVKMENRLSYRTPFQESLEDGIGITETVSGRHSEAGKELRAVVDEIKELLRKPQ